jgi:hypothetical protein
MVYKTVEGILHPDGTVRLSPADLPSQPVRVMVTILDPDEETMLTPPGDYLAHLTDYEERLARGEIQWR